jgi:hypothetical protein
MKYTDESPPPGQTCAICGESLEGKEFASKCQASGCEEWTCGSWTCYRKHKESHEVTPEDPPRPGD